jgi:hypothetical protein
VGLNAGEGGGGVCVVSANEYSCAHGAQINLGDLTTFLILDCHISQAGIWHSETCWSDLGFFTRNPYLGVFESYFLLYIFVFIT